KIYDGTPALEVVSTTGNDGFAWDVPVTDVIYTAPSSMDPKNPHRTDAEGPGWFAQNFTTYDVMGNMWVNVTYDKNAPPHAPTNLQAVSDEDSNTVLTWDPSISQDVTSYNIYIAKSLASLNAYISSEIPNVTVSVYSYIHVSGSEDWQKYWYGVKANDSENESVGHVQGTCGNWVVNKTTPQYVDNENITLKGTLHVFGNIELNDTILRIDSPSGYTFGIFINNSGNFKSENVTIMRNNTKPYYFKINPDAIVIINGSVIYRPGIDKYEGKLTKKGIYSLTKNLTITNTEIKIEYHGLGIYYTDNFNGNIYNVSFQANTNVQSAYLLNIYESSGVNITDCDLGTHATYGIYAQSSSGLNITGSEIVVDCYADAYWGIYMDDCSHSQIYNNIEINGRPAIFFRDSLNISIEATKIIAHNSFCIQGESSLLTTIRDCDFDEPDDRSDTTIYMLGCRASTILDMAINNQREVLKMEDESWSIIKNITLGGGDLGIRLVNSNNIYINDTYITFIQTGMIVTGCRDIYLINTVINLTFYCLDIYSPGPVNLFNCTIENGIGAEITAEGYNGEQGEINL
ncbi:MAG: right-handed parallel beta-helix repeat-containing protein, partial [Thermoplasmata archaeon]|nr:right-handed parallel beta-helix repeat-containing protein [Thermoplasmata archaeon]